ncbi:MAG: Formate dehydrogenase-like protein cytochrome b subunit, partial [Gemmatimonadetes bacterium]|nr:Formate dehydrogenase-like protein cytochrome b subunit [Gemmatimonadota bacterium]
MSIRSWSFVSLVAAILLGWTTSAAASGPEECLACHSEQGFTMERRGKTVSLFVDQRQLAASPHAKLECTACHKGFQADALPHAARIRPVNCLACHDGAKFEHYAESVHATAKPSVTCADCHGGHAVQRVTDKDPVVRHEFAAKVCSQCHTDVSKHYAASDHGKALAQGVKGAPSCIDCHGEHAVASPTDTTARTSRLHSEAMCLSCHIDNPDVRARVGPSAGFISSYDQSVHGQALSGGNAAAATCIDCHGSHDMMKGSNPASRVAKGRIAETCAACHADVAEQYAASVHGRTLQAGVAASATCTDCHGEHGILSPRDPRSPVAPSNVSAQVCSPCHASVSLTRKYGLRGDRFQSFEDSYHGLATRAGSIEVANCASCHGVHDIKPSSDPTSRIAPANLAATCG